MKKLLLILLCLPMIFSCGDKGKTKKLEDRIAELETANKAKYAPEHSVSTTIEISDDNNTQMGAENLLEGPELFSGKNNLEDEIVILQSYALAEKTITALGIDTSLTKEYRAKLEVSPLKNDSSILKLSIRVDKDAIRENIVYLNKLTEIYIRNKLEDKKLGYELAAIFLKKELKKMSDSLSLTEQYFVRYKNENKITDLSLEAQSIYSRINVLEIELAESKSLRNYYNYLENYIDKGNEGERVIAPTSVDINNAELNNLINQLLELYVKKKELQLTTTKKNPNYIAVLAQIDHAKETIIENVRNLIASTSIYEKDLEKRINKMESFLNHRPEVERELDSLVCLRENYETRKNFLWLKLTDAETAAATIVSDVILIDSARLDGETSIK